MKNGQKWSREEDAYLRQHYANDSTAEIAAVLQRTPSGCYNRSRKLGLKKSYEFKLAVACRCTQSEASKATRFKKGQVSHNKGKKIWQFMSPEAIERSARTRFKPGDTPWNVHPVGYEYVNSEGYVMIRVAESKKMVRKHIWTWERHNGPVPEGKVVTFRDGNKLNCDITNLELVTRSELARRLIASRTPQQRLEINMKVQATRNESIRKDKMRIRWGLEPYTKLVKKWYAPQI